jgi:hypothetical protein
VATAEDDGTNDDEVRTVELDWVSVLLLSPTEDDSGPDAAWPEDAEELTSPVEDEPASEMAGPNDVERPNELPTPPELDEATGGSLHSPSWQVCGVPQSESDEQRAAGKQADSDDSDTNGRILNPRMSCFMTLAS